MAGAGGARESGYPGDAEGGNSAAAIELAEVDAHIIDWSDEVKETGEPERLPLIATGLRNIAAKLERQATHID